MAGLDVYVLGSHASLAGALTVALGIALAPTVSPADASSIEAFVTGHLPTTVPGHASATVSPRLALAISDGGGVLEANLWAPDVVAWVNAVTSGTATHPPLPPTPAGP